MPDKYVVTGSSLTSVADAIRSKSGGSGQLSFPTGFVNEIGKISGVPRSDVNFFDYDGTIVAAYTAAEWTASQTLPSNPSHSGLTAQGWNYTVAQINAEVAAQGKCDVGQMYVTQSGKNEIDISITDSLIKNPYLGVGVNGTAVIDWGDGSPTDTVTGTRLDVPKRTQHTYATTGDYTITVWATSGTMSFYEEYGRLILSKNVQGEDKNAVYANMVRAVRIGNNTQLTGKSFQNCFSLEYITIPNSVTSIGSYVFNACYSLRHITIPSNVTSVGSSSVADCFSLKSISIPSGFTTSSTNTFSSNRSLEYFILPTSAVTFNTNAFYNCRSLREFKMSNNITEISNSMFDTCMSLVSITIPSSVTNIKNTAFNKCYGMKEYHFKPTTPPTLESTNVFNYMESDCVIYVPYSADHSILEAYQTATNWSTYASHMQEESA